MFVILKCCKLGEIPSTYRTLVSLLCSLFVLLFERRVVNVSKALVLSPLCGIQLIALARNSPINSS